MNLFDIFEGAIDDLEARRIEDLNAKMDDLTARAKDTSDPKFKEALRHEFARAKAERDSYYKINVDEASSDSKVMDPDEVGYMLSKATIQKIVNNAFAQKLPDVKPIVKTLDADNGAYSITTSDDMFNLELSVIGQLGDIGVFVENAYNSYKNSGVVTDIIRGCYTAAEHQWGKPQTRTLQPVQDTGHGVWQAMADKLGVTYEAGAKTVDTGAAAPTGKSEYGVGAKVEGTPPKDSNTKTAILINSAGLEWAPMDITAERAQEYLTGMDTPVTIRWVDGTEKPANVTKETVERYDAQIEAKKAYNFIRDNWMDDIELRKYAGTTRSPQSFYQAVHAYRKKAREDNIVASLARAFDSVYTGSNDSPWHEKESSLEEHGGGGGGPREWHNYVKAHRTDEVADTNYTYTVFIDGTKEGTYGSKEEARAVVARKKQQAPGRDYRIAPKSRTNMASIKRFQKNRDREIEEAANPAQQAAIAINMKKHHQKPKTEGAKVDRMQKHIASSEKDLGHSKKDAEAIGWATLNKRGYLDNKNKKNHTNESLEKVPTEKLQALWNQHKDEQRPNPAFAQQLRLVAKELARRKDVDEASMDWASHKSTGPKFSGYLKGTDPAPTEYGNKSFGGCEEEEMEEGIDGNMTVRSSPLSQPLRKRNFVAKNAIQSGAGKHANQLKKAAAAGRHAKHKGQPLDLDEGDNFLTWAVRNGYNLNKPAVYESARNTYKALVEDCGPIAPHKTYYGAMDESLKKGEYYVWTVFFDDGSSKRIKVTSDEFDPYEYYAKQKKNVINVDYNWEIQQ